MILSRFTQPFKNKWLAQQEAKLKAEFAPQLAAVQSACQQQLNEIMTQKSTFEAKYQELQRLQAQLSDQEAILNDRKLELEKANEELRTQLRLIEAKASPDSVWVEAFTKGYEKAWDSMASIWQHGLEKAVEKSRTNAIDETLRNINPLRPIHELLLKQKELESKRDQAKEPVLRQRYENYLEALSWSLNGHSLHPDESTS